MIELVSRPGCIYCDKAKAWLESNRIPYTVADGSRARGVPQLRIDGRVVMTGWNADEWGRKIRESKGSGQTEQSDMGEMDDMDEMDEIESSELDLDTPPSGSITESIADFFTTPAPPSELHRVAVTAVGGVGGRLISQQLPEFTPAVEAVAGVATILTGHFVFGRWEAKSIGYGLLGDAALRAAVAYSARFASSETVITRTSTRATSQGGVVSEDDYLANVEAVAEQTSASGQIASPAITHVRLPDNRIIPVEVYNQNFAAKVAAARSRGQERGVRRRPNATSTSVPTPRSELLPSRAEQTVPVDAPLPEATMMEDRFMEMVALREQQITAGQPVTAVMPKFVKLIPVPRTARVTRILSIDQYMTEFPSKVAEAQARGRANATPKAPAGMAMHPYVGQVAHVRRPR